MVTTCELSRRNAKAGHVPIVQARLVDVAALPESAS